MKCDLLLAGLREAAIPLLHLVTHRSKINIFAPQRRLVAPIHVKFGTADGHVVPLGRAKFHANRCTGVGTRPQNGKKIPLFGKESPRRGEPFDRFLQLLSPNYPALVFYI